MYYVGIKWPTRTNVVANLIYIAAGQTDRRQRMASTGFDLGPYSNYILEYKLAAE